MKRTERKSAKKRVAEYLGLSTDEFVHDSVIIEVKEEDWREWLMSANGKALSEYLDAIVFEGAPHDVCEEVHARLKALADAGDPDALNSHWCKET